MNYDNFASFDINECCDHFDSEKQSNWKKINKFIVADGQEFAHIMESEFVLVRCDDEPEDFVKRVLKKPITIVESWV